MPSCSQLQHKRAAESLARDSGDGLLLRRGPRQVVDCSLSMTHVQSRLQQHDHSLCLPGSLALSIGWLPGLADHSDFFLREHPCSVLAWTHGLWPVAGRWSAFLEWYLLSQSRRAAFC